MSDPTLHQQELIHLWERHLKYEFEDQNENLSVSEMTEDACVNHVPTMSGAQGRENVRKYYGQHFVHCNPPDMKMTPISRTVGNDRLVDEFVADFTHTVQMDWMLPAVPPTGKKVKIAMVVIVYFRDGQIAREHIYWDQASVLMQLGFFSPGGLQAIGAEAAEKVLTDQ